MPAFFLAHGTPMWIDTPTGHTPAFLNTLGSTLSSSSAPPKCIVICSAHWETEGGIKVTCQDDYTMLYDFYGFPQHYYKVSYPAKGHREVAQRTVALIKEAGFAVAEETSRGLDHGVFIPMMYMFPKCNIPIVVVSLPVTKNPLDYYNLGAALRPLRAEGVLLIGAGYVVHNLKEFQKITSRMGQDKEKSPPQPWASTFGNAVEDAITKPNPSVGRKDLILGIFKHEKFKLANPTHEHFAPLIVAAGAATDDEPARVINQLWTFSLFSDISFQFGST